MAGWQEEGGEFECSFGDVVVRSIKGLRVGEEKADIVFKASWSSVVVVGESGEYGLHAHADRYLFSVVGIYVKVDVVVENTKRRVLLGQKQLQLLDSLDPHLLTQAALHRHSCT